MAEPLTKPEASLYEADFYAWTQDQAARFRARARLDNGGDIDWENAAEEIESLGRSDKREIRSRLEIILAHLLKWQFQAAKRKWGWRSTIEEQRSRLVLAINDSPSLRTFPNDALAAAYRLAIKKAAEETDLPDQVFPPDCPYTIEQILDPAFYPEAQE